MLSEIRNFVFNAGGDHMKLGLAGPATTVDIVKKVMARDFAEIGVVAANTQYYKEAYLCAEELQQAEDLDAILFTCPTNYHDAIAHLRPTIPWDYLQYNRPSLLRAVTEAVLQYGVRLDSVSIDSYPEELVRRTLLDVGVKEPVIYRAPYDPQEPNYERKTRNFHRKCYEDGRVSFCLTSIEHIHQPLQERGIPCIRIMPSDEDIREALLRLQFQAFNANAAKGSHAVITVRYDYIFDDEKNLELREWEKIRYQNEFKERIYTVAELMGAAVFSAGNEQYYIVADRSAMLEVFLKGGENRKLLQFGQRSSSYRAWTGIGVGKTMLEAKSRASQALNHSIADGTGSSYLAENEGEAARLATVSADESVDYGVISRACGISRENLEKIREAAGRNGKVMTSKELAACLGLTERSADRLIARLEEAGYASFSEKVSSGKGRPARLISIDLPEIDEFIPFSDPNISKLSTDESDMSIKPSK